MRTRISLGYVLLSLAGIALASTVYMTGPFPDTTCLNAPVSCNLPSPTGRSSVCASNGTQPSALACSNACLSNASCTSYTWHNSDDEWKSICVFRTDGQWQPLTGATDHVAGQKVSFKKPSWPIQDGFDSLPAMWFGANTSGLDSEETLELISRFRIGGYGWQQGTGSLSSADNVGRGEVHLVSAAAHLSDYLTSHGKNRTLVFVYRQIQVALRLFALNVAAADNPRNDAFWLHDPQSGALCLAGQPWHTEDPFWNFSNPDAAAYWLNQDVAEVAQENVDGVQAVFFDEVDQAYCGYWNSNQGGCAKQSADVQRELQAANNDMLAKQVALLNSANVIPLLSLDNRMQKSGDGLSIDLPCKLPEDATVAAIAAVNGTWARFYENWPGSFWVPDTKELHAAMIANAILEGEAGVPQLLHAGGPGCPAPARNITRPGRLGGGLEYVVATFLIVQTPQTVLSISNNWYDQDFCWHPEFDVKYGRPLGPALRTSPYAWVRNFTGCNVHVDASTGVGEVYLL